MKVFVDRHHDALFNSFILLFEKRLGWELNTQAGLEWYEEKFWNVYDHPDTATQYLKREVERERGITLNKFKETNFDILIASLPQHIAPFRKLIELYQPKAKLIYQIGNAWNISPEEAAMLDGVMASAKVPFTGTILGHNGKPLTLITYHQEFDLNIFNLDLPNESKNIYSFVNCFNTANHFKNDWELFENVEKLMPESSLKALGGQCRDGTANGTHAVADKMHESQFIWHTKHGGDGYGHVIFSAFACGRPLIVKKEYYIGKLAEPLIEDGVTAITIDGLSPEQIVEKVRKYYDLDLYRNLHINSYERFYEIVDFNKEEKLIRTFLDNVLI